MIRRRSLVAGGFNPGRGQELHSAVPLCLRLSTLVSTLPSQPRRSAERLNYSAWNKPA